LRAREYLQNATLTAEMVDRFLDPDAENWAAFDPVLGYRLRDSVVRDGMDGSFTISSYPHGARRMINYPDAPCRINTYGDSFTQCHQVSDGETWQEYLSGHFGESIRNFGVGGYGVYQAYMRMIQEEAGESAAENIVLNIWSDDHFRSVMSWRWLHILEFRRHLMQPGQAERQVSLFHANPWAHVTLNTETGLFEERENPYATPQSLYRLCDPDHIYEEFAGDDYVQILLARNGIEDVDRRALRRISRALDYPIRQGDATQQIQDADGLRRLYGLRASMYIVDKAQAFAAAHRKRLLVLLSYDSNAVVSACRNESRFDSIFVDYLKESGMHYVDSLESHMEDYSRFSGDPEDYVNRYYIGHYNPLGNHFFAFAIKQAMVAWLDPKPPTYNSLGPHLAGMAGTLA
jgi:hypothetical protein